MLLLQQWPPRLTARKRSKGFDLTPQGLIQVLHFSSKVRAPGPAALRRHDVWPSWFHKKARACFYDPTNKGFVRVSTIYVVEAIRIKYGIIIPYTWEVLEHHLDALLGVIFRTIHVFAKKAFVPRTWNATSFNGGRSARRAAAFQKQKMADFRSLSRRNAVRDPERDPSGRYVPPHARNVERVRPEVCPVCDTKYRYHTRNLFQDFNIRDKNTHDYYRRQNRLVNGEVNFATNPHEKRVAERAREAARFCNCNFPAGTGKETSFHRPPPPVEDDDDYFASLAVGLGL